MNELSTTEKTASQPKCEAQAKRRVRMNIFLSCKMVKYVSMPALNFYSESSSRERVWRGKRNFTNKLKKIFPIFEGFFFWIIKLAPSCICTVAMPNIRQKLFMKLGEKHGVRVWEEEEEFRYLKRKKSWGLIAHVDCRCRRCTGNIRLISYLLVSSTFLSCRWLTPKSVSVQAFAVL